MALDNVLIAEIITLLNTGFVTLNNLVPVPPIIQQSYQPVQQGANTPPTIYLFKVSDNRLGFPYRNNAWNAETETEVFQTIQQYETTFQANCWATQDPANTASLTASDLANYAAYIIQSDSTVTALEANGWGIYRVSQVRNPSFTDDRDRFEFAPSFDFTITHKQIITLTSPIITETVLQVLEV